MPSPLIASMPPNRSSLLDGHLECQNVSHDVKYCPAPRLCILLWMGSSRGDHEITMILKIFREW